jgi:CRISPR-associated protein Cst2
MIDTKVDRTDGGISHIVGTFVIDAAGSYLNGAGLRNVEDRNISEVKAFWVNGSNGKVRIPYWSSQSFRRALRDTLIEETGWPASELKALAVNKDGNVSKIGAEFNPLDFPEDDIFGYMRTEKGSGKAAIDDNVADNVVDGSEGEQPISAQPKGRKRVRTLARESPLSNSIVMSINNTSHNIHTDEAYVHLTEGNPLPYSTEFYDTTMQGIFSLNYRRLGVFTNIGDRIELDESENKADQFLKDGKVHILTDKGKLGRIYEMKNAETERKKRASELLKALSVLRGGAKQAAFGTDISPKVLVCAGLTCGNPIFNNSLFTDDKNGIVLRVETMKEIVEDYKNKICTPVFVGIRSGFLGNQDDVRTLTEHEGVNFKVTTPIDAANQMANTILSEKT